MEQESERKLKEAKQRGDELVKQKLANEKILNEATYKFNEYLKEFPDHEKKKEEAKLEEKKRKQEQRQKAKQEQQVKSAQKKKKDQDSRIEKALEEDSNETEWQKWDKWNKEGNLPPKDTDSIFNNRHFKLATVSIALISILVLVFS